MSCVWGKPDGWNGRGEEAPASRARVKSVRYTEAGRCELRSGHGAQRAEKAVVVGLGAGGTKDVEAAPLTAHSKGIGAVVGRGMSSRRGDMVCLMGIRLRRDLWKPGNWRKRRREEDEARYSCLVQAGRMKVVSTCEWG